jgi:hypothetical protein
MDKFELERIRRSIAMLPPGHSAGALTREAALALVAEVEASKQETARYRQAVEQLRQILDAIES